MYTWTMFISPRLLEADKQYEEEWYNLTKALSMDKSHTEIYKDISDVYEKERDFPRKAIEAYKIIWMK